MRDEHFYGLGGESLFERRSLVALCIAHCSQFENYGDSTMQSYNVKPYIMCPKCTSCHKAIMVIAGRAHCIMISCLFNLAT